MNDTNDTYTPNAIDPAILSVLDVELEGKVVTAETWKSLWNLVITHINSIDAYLVTIDQLRIEWEQGLEFLNTIIEEFRTKYEALASSFIHYGDDAPENEHIRLWCKPVGNIQDYGFITADSFNYRGYFPSDKIVLNDTLRTGFYSITKGSTFVFKQGTTELLESEYTAASHGLLIVSENSTSTKKIIQFIFYGILTKYFTADEINSGIYSAHIKKTLSDDTWTSTASDFHNMVETDQTYDSTSTNAQSGTAVAEAVQEVADTIPTKTSDLTNDSGFGTYSKPSGGIPKTDLDTNVKSSLEKADSALQEHQSLEGYATEDYVDDAVDTKYTKPSGGIPKTDLSSSVQESLGKADTALQTHQSLDGKQDKFAEVSESTYSRYLSLTRNTIISGILEVPDPSRGSAVAHKDYVDNTVSTKYTKPSTGIPETDLASAVSTKINNSYVYDTKPFEVIPIGDEEDGSKTFTEDDGPLTTRLVINKDINNVPFNFRKILINITVPADITEGTPTGFMVGSNSYTTIATPTIGKIANYPMRFVGVFELRNGILFTDGAYSTGSPSNPQGAIYKSYNALGTALNSLTMISIDAVTSNLKLPIGTNIKILAVKGE